MPHTRSAGGDLIWRPTRLAIYARDGWACLVCGWTPEAAEVLRELIEGTEAFGALEGAIATRGLTLDHVRPPSRGGGTGPRSLATLCQPCNSGKGARTISEWRPERAPVVLGALRRRVDAELGRRLCEVLYPGWLDKQRARRAAARRRKAA